MAYATTLTIDGEPVDVLQVIPLARGECRYRLMVRPRGAEVKGPHSQHDVPQMEGSFRTNGHLYKFGIEGDSGLDV